MLSEQIVLQSAGSLAVAILALLMLLLQALFYLGQPQFRWYAWSAAISFSAFAYALGVFIEYNAPPGGLNHAAGLLEYTALIGLVHCFYGFTFSYLDIRSRAYHTLATAWHTLILGVLWSGDVIVARRFAARHFSGLNVPFIEADLGPLGPLFVLYVALSGVCAVFLWVRNKQVNPRYRRAYLAGMVLWLLLGIHDGLASMGMPTLQYLMEYGFLAFAVAVLWVVFNSHLEIAAEERYRVITEYASDGILVIQDGKVVFANPACGELIGHTPSETAPIDILDTMAPDDRRIVSAYYDRLLDGGAVPKSYPVRLRRADGQEHFVEIASSRIRFRDRPAVLAVLRDVTDRKREECTRRQSEKKLARLRKMESLGLLAGGVAHDLNNVLSGIVTYPDLILADLPADSRLRKPIETMQKAGNRAAAIVQDLLTLARRGVETEEVIDLNRIVGDFLHSPEYEKIMAFHPAAACDADLAADLLHFKGSPVHVSKALMNLISNAAEAMPEGGRIVVATANRYLDRTVKGYEEIPAGEYVVLSVSDTGVGICTEERERLFEPFFTKKVMGRSGTGLGMAVVWGTVKDHHGFTDIDSAIGRGTTFTLFFPATREPLAAVAASPSLDTCRGMGESILVVDDDGAQREIACEILSRLGYTVSAVSSGEQALDFVTRQRVALLVLDMIMDPGMDGLDTYRRILEIQPDQKAILASGFSETDRVGEALRLGAGRYVKKPYAMAQLGLAVRGELDR